MDSAPSATSQIQEGNEPVRHTVRSGETAQSIAALYNVSVTELSSWNWLDSELSVRNGQQLLIPTSNKLSEVSSQTKSPTDIKDSENLTAENDKKTIKPTKNNTNIRKMIRPVNGEIIRDFSNKSGGSEGIDYEVPEGTKVKAAANGTVALVSKSVGDTTIVLLRHDNNIYTVYSNITDV